MFMNIRRYRIGGGQRDEVVRRVDEGWADQLRSEPGFLTYHLVASGPDELVSATACLDEQALAIFHETGNRRRAVGCFLGNGGADNGE